MYSSLDPGGSGGGNGGGGEGGGAGGAGDGGGGGDGEGVEHHTSVWHPPWLVQPWEFVAWLGLWEP